MSKFETNLNLLRQNSNAFIKALLTVTIFEFHATLSSRGQHVLLIKNIETHNTETGTNKICARTRSSRRCLRANATGRCHTGEKTLSKAAWSTDGPLPSTNG